MDIANAPKEGEYGVKDAAEFLRFMDTSLAAFAGIFSDGKAGFSDLRYIPRVIQDSREGFDGFKNIRHELMELSDSELAFILSQIDTIQTRTDQVRAAVQAIVERREKGLPPVGLFS